MVEYHQQLLISATDVTAPEGWAERRARGYRAWHHPAIPIHELVNQDGESAGFIFGWPISKGGRFIDTSATVEVDSARPESLVDELGGRYAILWVQSNRARVYLDPLGSLGLVYSTKERSAASTVGLLCLNQPDHLVWTTSLGQFPDDAPSQFYPFDLTCDSAIRRLLPNHYLDLVSNRAIRHYPSTELKLIRDSDLESTIDQITDLITMQLQAVIEEYPTVYLPLTAGRDSRLTLACSYQWRKQIEYVTFDYPGAIRTCQVDMHVARKIAKKFALTHRVLPVGEATSEDRLDYLRRIGFSGGSGKCSDFHRTCLDKLDMNAAWLPGFSGEAIRSYYSMHNPKLTTVTGTDLLAVLGLPQRRDFLAAAQRWLGDLPEYVNDVTQVLDFAYLELRDGCWACPHLYGAAPFALQMIPFCRRDIYELMFRLPRDYRVSLEADRAVVRRAWPELSVFPYQDWLFGARKIEERARWFAARVIRRILGR